MNGVVRSWWAALTPTAKRNLSVAGFASAGLAGVVGLALLAPEVAQPVNKQAVVKHILTDTDPRALGLDGLAAQLREQSRQFAEFRQKLQTIEEQQKSQRLSDEERFKRYTTAERQAYEERMKALAAEVDALRNPPGSAEGTASEKRPQRPARPSRGPGDRDDLNAVFEQASRAPAGPAYGAGASTGRPAQNAPAAPLQIRVIKDDTLATASNALPTPSVQHPPVFIPAGSILSGVLLNGMDAPTGRKAQKQPMPVLVRVKQEAILPNRFRADVRECFLVSAGYGDLSAERAYIRSETFSCVRDDGGVIEVPLDAYATGEDGKTGIRGRVVEKRGQLLANALAAGFLRGFSDAFGRNQIPVILTGGAGLTGGAAPFQRAFSQQAMEGGALRGAGYAMDRLAHYYMDLAENLFPVIEVDASRKVSFIVQKGTTLKLNH